MVEKYKQVTSLEGCNLFDIVVRMDGGPSSVYKIVEMHDDGLCNIRVNDAQGLKCHGSWVYYKYLRKATQQEIDCKYRQGASTLPEIKGDATLCGLHHDEIVVLKDPKEINDLFHIATLIKTGYDPAHTQFETGVAEIKCCYCPNVEPRWVDVKEIRKATNTELSSRRRFSTL